jgi:CarboxypepD_reg-like domain
MKYVILFYTALSVTNISTGQKNKDAKSLTVTGSISACSGQSISSVSVNVKGRTIGHPADKNGHFSINDVRDGDSLLFTHISYKPVSIKIKGNNIVNVTMEQNVRSYSPLR